MFGEIGFILDNVRGETIRTEQKIIFTANYNDSAAPASSIQVTVPLTTSTKPAGSGFLSTKICYKVKIVT